MCQTFRNKSRNWRARLTKLAKVWNGYRRRGATFMDLQVHCVVGVVIPCYEWETESVSTPGVHDLHSRVVVKNPRLSVDEFVGKP